MADQRWSDILVVFTKILCGRNFCVRYVTKLKLTGQLQMASLSLYPQFETNLMSNRKVIELVLQLKSAKAQCKNYIKVKPHLVRHLLRNRLLPMCLHFDFPPEKISGGAKDTMPLFLNNRLLFLWYFLKVYFRGNNIF